MLDIKRREFIALVGGGCVLLAVKIKRAWGQQAAVPIVGFVNAGSSDAPLAAAFRKGLNEVGYFEGQNVTVEYHWLDGQFDRLPAVMADLAHRHVSVIATPAGNFAAQAAKARPRQPRSSSASAKIQSSFVWSPASPGQAET
jgi:hypothetical protein